MKKDKGITLISLVVTIVIIIILATVTISLSIGKNGIFTRAKETKKLQIITEVKEQIGTEILAAQVDAFARNEELEQSQVEDIISKYGELQEDKDTMILKDNGYEISLLEIYNGTTTETGSYTENKAKIELLEKQVAELQKMLDGVPESKIMNLGQITSYDVKANYPENYQKLTSENFIIQITEEAGSTSKYYSDSSGLYSISIGLESFSSGTISYDSEKGILTVTPPSGKVYMSSTGKGEQMTQNLDIGYKVLIII